jgi:hypothetical protein
MVTPDLFVKGSVIWSVWHPRHVREQLLARDIRYGIIAPVAGVAADALDINQVVDGDVNAVKNFENADTRRHNAVLVVLGPSDPRLKLFISDEIAKAVLFLDEEVIQIDNVSRQKL